MKFESWLQEKTPSVSPHSALAVLKLAAEGGTVPFIARYRKEATGNLDEVQIRNVLNTKEEWDKILQRQKSILEQIEKQGKLTDSLKTKISSSFDLNILEDLYLPFKQKRKTKAALAREAGLEPLATWIWEISQSTSIKPEQTLEEKASTFCSEETKIKTTQEAIDGAQAILVEKLSENSELRQKVRDQFFKKGFILSSKGKKAKEHSKFEKYFGYFEPVSSLLQPGSSHRYLAMRRGWLEEELSVTMGGVPHPQEGGDQGFEESLISLFEKEICPQPEKLEAFTDLLNFNKRCARLALKVYVAPSIESEVHRLLREHSDQEAIRVFGENVRQVLLSAPLGPKTVLGVDPGIRTGCKLAVVQSSGKFIEDGVIFLQNSTQMEQSGKTLLHLIEKNKIDAIAVGNGTAGRETETFIRKLLKPTPHAHLPVILVNESGASIYSASDVAREEFPNLDLTVRGAISIARRLQDPLAELVKIDPKSIGVGQYQHDVSQTGLKKSLDETVESCVNSVGVSLNTASVYLLSHVSGIGPGLAKSLVQFREENGLFLSRQELLKVPRFSQKIFEQAAGFLRIAESSHPLDHTAVHPEVYPVLEAHAQRLGKTVKDFTGSGVRLLKADQNLKKEVGEFTFNDVLNELEKPGRDPRDSFESSQFREDIFSLEDLKAEMSCPGIVTNVTNFGAFVDIGVHQDGLVHISELSDQFVKDPRDVVKPGQKVQVRVVEINVQQKRISLSMKTKPSVNAKTDPAHLSSHPKDSRQVSKQVSKAAKIVPKEPAAPFNNPFGKLGAGLRSHSSKR
jgi:protein Tex